MDDNAPKENPSPDFNKLDLSQLQSFSFGTQWTQDKQEKSAPDGERRERSDRPRRDDRRPATVQPRQHPRVARRNGVSLPATGVRAGISRAARAARAAMTAVRASTSATRPRWIAGPMRVPISR
jgi:hypothetical protein